MLPPKKTQIIIKQIGGQSKLKFGKSRRALNFMFCQWQAGTTELQDNNSNKLKLAVGALVVIRQTFH